MTGLPSGWVRAPLGWVADVIAGQAPSGDTYNSSDIGLPLYQGKTDFGDLYLKAPRVWTTAASKVAEPGDVLLSVRAPVGPTNLATAKCAIGRGLAAIRGRSGVSQKYLLYALRATEATLVGSATGTTFAAVTGSVIRDHEVPVAPSAEQERIVSAIEEQLSQLDAGVAALESARRKLTRMRTAVLQAVVTGHLVEQDQAEGTADPLVAQARAARDATIAPTGRSRSIPLDYLHDHLPAIPHSWRWVSLDSLADVVGGVTKDVKKQTSPKLQAVPYLRVANVQRGYLDLRSVATIKATSEQIAALRLQGGDVLFNEGGDRDKLGRGWIWEGQIDPCIHQNHVFRARLYAPVIDPQLLSWHGNTFGQRWFDRGGKQTTNLASVSKTTLRAFPVPIPPLAEQQRIVAAVESYLSVIDAAEGMVQACEQRAEALRSSILVAAFSGKLVPQDPSDEPASPLLDHIAARRPPPTAAGGPPLGRRARDHRG